LKAEGSVPSRSALARLWAEGFVLLEGPAGQGRL